jgi:hypothetical protein
VILSVNAVFYVADIKLLFKKIKNVFSR